ncbi:hypothetical protein [Paenibacillus sanfengchensis]|uniref:hypothetical protein n=1 Tax=Paenibacillus sanfengchensis TaxID=3119819 RepID=UPI002FE0AB16
MNHRELFPIVEKLEEHRIKYALGGSGLMHFLGLIDSVNDWDITVACPKDTLLKAISGYEWIEQTSGDGLQQQAIGMYTKARFVKVAEHPSNDWGKPLLELTYELKLG